MEPATGLKQETSDCRQGKRQRKGGGNGNGILKDDGKEGRHGTKNTRNGRSTKTFRYVWMDLTVSGRTSGVADVKPRKRTTRPLAGSQSTEQNRAGQHSTAQMQHAARLTSCR